MGRARNKGLRIGAGILGQIEEEVIPQILTNRLHAAQTCTSRRPPPGKRARQVRRQG
jgi:hypothetical protein